MTDFEKKGWISLFVFFLDAQVEKESEEVISLAYFCLLVSLCRISQIEWSHTDVKRDALTKCVKNERLQYSSW